MPMADGHRIIDVKNVDPKNKKRLKNAFFMKKIKNKKRKKR